MYFSGIVLPQPPPAGANAETPATPVIDRVLAEALDPGSADARKRDVVTVFETSSFAVAPGATASLPLNVYFGPRAREVLKSDYYSTPPRSYDRTLVIPSGMCAWCTFDWLINVLVWMLGVFHWIFGGFAGHGDWGLAIIGLVLIVVGLIVG